MTGHGLFTYDDADMPRRVRAVLDAAGYDDEGVVTTLGVNQEALGHKKQAVLLHRTSGGSPLETLVRLFILDVAVPLGDAQRALAPMSVEEWAAIGLLEVKGDDVRARVQLRCYQDLVVAFDFIRRGPGGVAAEFVMGISPSTLTLASLVPWRVGGRTLDLGTGSGFLALLASSHADHVVATDLNPRAVEMARFNVQLNGRDDRITCSTGDLFEPVAGQAFDLVISNAPYVIAPERTHLFLHGQAGHEGDALCEQIARTAPQHLAEGGICQFQANWSNIAGQDGHERLARWFEGSGCEVLVLPRGELTPEEYAEAWIEIEGRETAAFDAAFERWMRFFGESGIESVGAGVITMRRASEGSGWFHVGQAPENMVYPAGASVLRALDAQAFLHRHQEDLLDQPLCVAPDVRLEQTHRFGDEGWEAERIRIRRIEGLLYSGSIDPLGAQLLAGCDGQRPVGEVLAVLSDQPDAPPDAKDRLAAIVRALVEQAFLLPVAD